MFVAALFRSMLAHRLRLVLTGLAIALGVAFMAGSFVFSATLTSGLDNLFAEAGHGTDVQVSHVTPGGSTVTGSPEAGTGRPARHDQERPRRAGRRGRGHRSGGAARP